MRFLLNHLLCSLRKEVFQGSHVSRLNVRKRERSIGRLEEQMEELGVEVDQGVGKTDSSSS